MGIPDIAINIIVSFWLMELRHFQNVVRNPAIKKIKIDSNGDMIWKVPNGTWNDQEGRAMVSLLFDRVPEFKNEKLGRDERPLKLKIEAYSIRRDGSRIDRLIKDWYFTTDEPFSDGGSRLWSSWGQTEFEYGLAGIWAYPKEEVIVKL